MSLSEIVPEKVDRVAAAERLLAQANGLNVEKAAVLVSAAQVHATLALVEQQRIANLQEERSILWKRYERQGGQESVAAQYKALDEQIQEGLGL